MAGIPLSLTHAKTEEDRGQKEEEGREGASEAENEGWKERKD